MTIHIDELYRERLQPDEYIRMINSIFEFRWETRQPVDPPDKTSLLWAIGINSDGDEVDCLSLRFEFPGKNPSSVVFPLVNTRGITSASLFARYITAKATVEA